MFTGSKFCIRLRYHTCAHSFSLGFILGSLSPSVPPSLSLSRTHTYHLSSSLCLSNLIDLSRYRDCIPLVVRLLYDTRLGHSTMH